GQRLAPRIGRLLSLTRPLRLTVPAAGADRWKAVEARANWAHHVRMDPAIRRITPDDWRQVRSLRLAALKEAPFAFVEQYQDAVTRADQHWRERVARHAAGATASIFVAEHRDRLVGKAGCFIEPELTDHVSAQIFGVYVLPPYRGSGTADAL